MQRILWTRLKPGPRILLRKPWAKKFASTAHSTRWLLHRPTATAATSTSRSAELSASTKRSETKSGHKRGRVERGLSFFQHQTRQGSSAIGLQGVLLRNGIGLMQKWPRRPKKVLPSGRHPLKHLERKEPGFAARLLMRLNSATLPELHTRVRFP